MKRCVIVGGADITDYKSIKKYLLPDDYYIFCDCGLRHAGSLGVMPHLIVGDYDSSSPGFDTNVKIGSLNRDLNFRNVKENVENAADLISWNSKNSECIENSSAGSSFSNAEILVIPHEKFDTDTVYGVREGISRGFRDFLLIGVIGQRLYHTLANIYILKMLDSMGLHGMIADDYSDMELISDGSGYITDDYKCFSLLNITGIARKVKIENARYCYLPGEEITCEYQYATSNEVLPGKTARVTVGEGSLLLIRDRKNK